MKLNKLLAPILGLSTVATVIVPVATSCTNETKSTNHISRPDCYIKQLVESDDIEGAYYCEYLINLDQDDYDANGFSVNLSFTEGYEIYGFDINDFYTRFQLDGNQLHVYVIYIGSQEPVDNNLHLNLTVKYGTQWQETVQVEAESVVDKFELVWNDELGLYASDSVETTSGLDYWYKIKISNIKTEYFSSDTWSIKVPPCSGCSFWLGNSEVPYGTSVYYPSRGAFCIKTEGISMIKSSSEKYLWIKVEQVINTSTDIAKLGLVL